MYTAILALLIGCALGWARAAQNGGKLLDKLQYAAVHAIMFGLVGLAMALTAGWLI